jgi:hypothetical protein
MGWKFSGLFASPFCFCFGKEQNVGPTDGSNAGFEGMEVAEIEEEITLKKVLMLLKKKARANSSDPKIRRMSHGEDRKPELLKVKGSIK